MSKPFIERRKYKRYEHHFMMFFYVKGKKDVAYAMSQVNNISLGGINFSSNARFPNGTIICVEIKTPLSEENIQIEGVVLECINLVDGNLCRIRIQFKDISKETMEILKNIETYQM